MALGTYFFRGIQPCPLCSGKCFKDRTLILALVKAGIFENRFSFQSWKQPGGLDDAWGECDRTGNDYKKFIGKHYQSRKGLWRSLSPTFCLYTTYLKVRPVCSLYAAMVHALSCFLHYSPFLSCLSLSRPILGLFPELLPKQTTDVFFPLREIVRGCILMSSTFILKSIRDKQQGRHQ